MRQHLGIDQLEQLARDVLAVVTAPGADDVWAIGTKGETYVALGDYASWGDAERIVVNVASLYREFSGDVTPPNVLHLFGLMAELYFARKKKTG